MINEKQEENLVQQDLVSYYWFKYLKCNIEQFVLDIFKYNLEKIFLLSSSLAHRYLLFFLKQRLRF